jgi:hypothetical protein
MIGPAGVPAGLFLGSESPAHSAQTRAMRPPWQLERSTVDATPPYCLPRRPATCGSAPASMRVHRPSQNAATNIRPPDPLGMGPQALHCLDVIGYSVNEIGWVRNDPLKIERDDALAKWRAQCLIPRVLMFQRQVEVKGWRRQNPARRSSGVPRRILSNQAGTSKPSTGSCWNNCPSLSIALVKGRLRLTTDCRSRSGCWIAPRRPHGALGPWDEDSCPQN